MVDRRAIGVTVVILLCGASAARPQAVPAGPEFVVEEFGYLARQPRAAVEPDGDFVIVWSYYFYITFRGRSFEADETPVTSSFQIAQGVGLGFGPQHADVMQHTGGGFVVAWEAYDLPDYFVAWQHWNADGSAAGSVITASQDTGLQETPELTPLADGDFLVVWDSTESVGGDADGRSIQARIYDVSGVPETPQFQLNGFETGDQRNPDIGVGSDGVLLAVWQSATSPGDDGFGESILGRLISTEGESLGPDFQINSWTTGNQRYPRVADADEDAFMVVWQSSDSPGNDTDSSSILGRRVSVGGSPLDSDFQLNTITTGSQYRPRVSRTAVGDLEVVWGRPGVQRRSLSPNGTPQGLAEQISAGSFAGEPDIEADGAGGFVVTWLDDYEVRARRFVHEIFADGFESGNTAAWSATVP